MTERLSRLAFERMPHRPPMLLLDAVLESDASGVWVRARPHAAADYPLRVGGVLYPIALVEVGAQAAAAHASLTALQQMHLGVIVALTGVTVEPGPVPDAPLYASAWLDGETTAAARYSFTVTGADRRIVAGAALLMLRAAE
ncbi:MAG: hypothetical protein AAFX81_19425 [Pseudomonadota bacterium]